MLERVWCGGQWNIQCALHFFERAMRLVEEAVDDTLAEIAVLVVIHFQDLLESALIDELLDIGELGRSALGLGTRSASDGAARLDTGATYLVGLLRLSRSHVGVVENE
jgi:hypothetical protein